MERRLPAAAGEVRWGIVGCGDVCEKKSGPALAKAKRSRIVAVMRRDKTKLADFAKHFDVEALLADPAVNAVYVATPPGSHCDIGKQVAAAGLPCYMEKPMARNGAECAAMAAKFDEAGVPCFVAFYRRSYPRYQKLKELVDRGVLGEIRQVSYRTQLRVDESGGGLFVDLGSHVLDLLDFVLGATVGQVAAVASGRPGEAEVRVAMTFVVGGSYGDALWDFEAKGGAVEDVLVIHGSAGTATLPDAMNGAKIDVVFHEEEDDDYDDEDSGGAPPRPMHLSIPPPDPVQGPMVQAVVSALIDGGEAPSTAASAERCSRAIDATLAEYYGGRDDDFWARPGTWDTGAYRLIDDDATSS